MELNNVQKQQIEELTETTSKEFAKIMLANTNIISEKELDDIYNESIRLEEEYCIQCVFDESYYHVASEYFMIDSDTIKQEFGFYGQSTLYMDSKGRGLIVWFY